MKFPKYTKNLRREGNKIFSYSTHVATIEGTELRVLERWSMTTTKHVNYVASYLGLTQIVDN